MKYVRSLHRRHGRYKERAFFVEGLRAVEEAMRAGEEPAFLFCTAAAMQTDRAQALLGMAQSRGVPVRMVSSDVMEAMADTVTPSGLLAVVPMSKGAISGALDLVLVVDQLRDPGNMGTMLRSALAAGVQVVLASAETVDLYSPKVVRAAMGAHFQLQLRWEQSWESIRTLTDGLQVLLASPAGEAQWYWQVDWTLPTALIVGGEAEGASAGARSVAETLVAIPMREGVESLNAGVAASILMFEAVRQRGHKPRR